MDVDAKAHLTETHARLSTSPVVGTVTVLEERVGYNYGYLRARLTLFNQDFLEVAEYFVVDAGRVQVQRYRYQWMDPVQQVLKKRWDNTKHFPDLPNFPHHVHVGSETEVVCGQVLSIIELIDLLEEQLI